MTSQKEIKKVYIWDLDETIIIFQSFLTSQYADKFKKDQIVMQKLGLEMEKFIFRIADDFLYFKSVEDYDQVHIDDVIAKEVNDVTDDDLHLCSRENQLSLQYELIKNVYRTYATKEPSMLPCSEYEYLLKLRKRIDDATEHWTGLALKSLKLIHNRPNCINVLATTTQLVPALAKLLLYGLGGVFNIENVYSATKIGKDSCFERIIQRFGRNVTYVAIGDGAKEEQAAKLSYVFKYFPPISDKNNNYKNVKIFIH